MMNRRIKSEDYSTIKAVNYRVLILVPAVLAATVRVWGSEAGGREGAGERGREREGVVGGGARRAVGGAVRVRVEEDRVVGVRGGRQGPGQGGGGAGGEGGRVEP